MINELLIDFCTMRKLKIIEFLLFAARFNEDFCLLWFIILFDDKHFLVCFILKLQTLKPDALNDV